jgi:hypothetical protein
VERELLSIVTSVDSWFLEYLYANPFVLFTDNRALLYLKEFKLKFPKLFRWSLILSQYTFELRPVPGPENPADYPSRYLMNAQSDEEDEEKYKSEDYFKRKGWYEEFYENVPKLLRKKKLERDGEYWIVYVKGRRLQVPSPSEYYEIMSEHSKNHIQARPWFKKLFRDYYWPRMFEDLRATVRECGLCQKMYKFPRNRDFYQHLVEEPNLEVQIDHVGPFKDVYSRKFWILTAIEKFTGKAFARVVSSTAIPDVILFLYEMVFNTFIPARIHADRAFINSTEFSAFCEEQGVRISSGTTSWSHGGIEALNQILQAKLYRLGVDAASQTLEGFYAKVLRVIHDHNSTPAEAIFWLSPNEILLGWRRRFDGFEKTPLLDFDSIDRLMTQRKQLQQLIVEEKMKTPIADFDFKSTDLVMIFVHERKRVKDETRNYGPYIVVCNNHNGTLTLQYSDDSTGLISEKKCYKYVPAATYQEEKKQAGIKPMP